MDDDVPHLRPWLGWTLAGIVIACALAGWLIVRGIGAAGDLSAAARTTTQLRAAITGGADHRFDVLAARIADHTASARSLTADPVWRAAQHLPWLGEGMTALSGLAEASDILAQDALPPLISATADMDLGSLGVGGEPTPDTTTPAVGARTIDLNVYPVVALRLERAGAAAERSAARMSGIDPHRIVGPARDDLVAALVALSDAQRSVLALRGAARLLPAMLGEHETRTYLMAVHNGTDLRAGGGVIETVVQLEARSGAVTLVRATATHSLPALTGPLPGAMGENRSESSPLPELARIPSFPQLAALLAEYWSQHFGTSVDGVIGVDLDVLPAVLAATGAISFSGYTVDAASAVETLTVTMPRERDGDRQGVILTEAIVAAVNATLSRAVPRTVVSALAQAADAGHIRIWSDRADEQAVFAASDLGGLVPATDAVVGVLVDDTTGGRMGAYITASATLALGECAGAPTTRVAVTWTNGAAHDDHASLPPGVTGPPTEGFNAGGAVRVRIGVYGPPGTTAAPDTGQDAIGRHPIVWRPVIVGSGESETVTVTFTGPGAGERIDRMPHTPVLGGMTLTHVPLECD